MTVRKECAIFAFSLTTYIILNGVGIVCLLFFLRLFSSCEISPHFFVWRFSYFESERKQRKKLKKIYIIVYKNNKRKKLSIDFIYKSFWIKHRQPIVKVFMTWTYLTYSFMIIFPSCCVYFFMELLFQV